MRLWWRPKPKPAPPPHYRTPGERMRAQSWKNLKRHDWCDQNLTRALMPVLTATAPLDQCRNAQWEQIQDQVLLQMCAHPGNRIRAQMWGDPR